MEEADPGLVPYRTGSSPEVDEAIRPHQPLDDFLAKKEHQPWPGISTP
jgi:hypothetical protein